MTNDTKAPDWEGFGRDLLEEWPVRDLTDGELFDAALRNGLIHEIPGGYDPDKHIDSECICPEPGDPWYEYSFGAERSHDLHLSLVAAAYTQGVKEAAQLFREHGDTDVVLSLIEKEPTNDQ